MSKRILVVEGQKDNRQIIRDTLAGSDYQITEAEDGEQALAAVAKQRPDLILMGIQLPIMDGYEVARRIKADPAFRSIPIIAVTDHDTKTQRQMHKKWSASLKATRPRPRSIARSMIWVSRSARLIKRKTIRMLRHYPSRLPN